MKCILKPKYWYYEEMSDTIFIDFFDADFGPFQGDVIRIGRARKGEVEELLNLIKGRQFFFSNFSKEQLLNLISK